MRGVLSYVMSDEAVFPIYSSDPPSYLLHALFVQFNTDEEDEEEEGISHLDTQRVASEVYTYSKRWEESRGCQRMV